MTEMAKLKINWTGFTGAPGYTNLYFRDFTGSGDVDQAVVDGAITKTDTWLNVWNSRLPASVNVKIDSQVEIIEDSTGALVRFMSGTPFQRGNGTGAGNYSAATGAVVNWYTNGIVRGRRLRGRSFMVPLVAAAFSTNGSIADGDLVDFRTASTALAAGVGTGDLGVWSRPSTPGGSDGSWYFVTSATVPDMTAVLRSRRD